MTASISLRRRFLRLAVPNILSNLMTPLAGLVDMAVLGHLSHLHHLAGVALGAILFEYVYWTFGFLRMGTTGLVAQAVGAGEPSRGLLIAARGAVIALATSLVLLLAQGPLREVGFWFLSGETLVESAGRAYFDARIIGAPAALLNLVVLGWLLGTERSRAALVVAVVGHSANIGLDILFIAQFGWGAAGAGWATAASQYLMLVLGLVFWWRTGVRLSRPALRSGLADVSALREFLSLSGDITVRTLLLVSTFAVFTNLAAGLGTVALAATAVLKNLVNLAAFLLDGFAFATESLAGIFRGARQPERLRELFLMACRWSFGTAAGFVAIVWIFPGPILRLFTDHSEALASMNAHVGWLAPVLGLGSVAYVLDGYFIGLAAGRTLSRTMIQATVVGFVPLAVVAWRTESLHVLWGALACFMLARVITLARKLADTWQPTLSRPE